MLCPTVLHENGSILDRMTWKRRGWCRYERLARVLSKALDATMLAIEHEGSVHQMGREDSYTEPVGLGDFSVEADRGVLAPRVRRMLHGRLQYLDNEVRLPEYRRMLSIFPPGWWRACRSR